MTMTITLNGKPHPLDDRIRLDELLASLGFTSGFAVALNREFVPRSEYGRTSLQAGDELEVLTPRQGG
jgi:sulfur carrier protein